MRAQISTLENFLVRKFGLFSKFAQKNSFRNWRFKSKSRSASQQNTVDWSPRVLPIDENINDPMKIFDPVLAVQKLIFGKFCEKGEVFSISEPISAALWMTATGDFHRRISWTILYICSSCADIVAAGQLPKLKDHVSRRAPAGWHYLLNSNLGVESPSMDT